jgi:hypothetical protein
MKQGLLCGTIATALFAMLGCVEDNCEALSECGGSVLSNSASDFYLADGQVDTQWWAYAGDECQDPMFTPPAQATLLNQPPHLSNEAPPERSSADWCSNLVIRADRTIKSVNLWFPQIPLLDAKLTYSGASASATEGYYQLQLRYFKKMRADFSAQCLTAQGVVMGCTEFTHAMQTVLAQEPNISAITCVNGPQGGCSCIYDMLLVTGVTGPWRTSGTVLTHYDDIGDFPAEADYCVQGNHLEMTGHDRTWLYNQTGLRTLDFELATCTDGKKNQEELGVDCGGPCSADCCADGLQSAGETGVDCGGPCAACP